MKSSSIHETHEDKDYKYWKSSQNTHEILRISNSIHNEYINLLYLLENATSVFSIVV
jgi:hypothetical protein